MSYVHYELTAGPTDTVQVTVDKQANVLLLDEGNYQSYRNRRGFRYHGGRALRSPVNLRPPHSGKWHVVIDLGGASGQIRSACRVI
ncbi:MAG: DUF1883 domain-containing protein [Polyangiaceae bacterium]